MENQFDDVLSLMGDEIYSKEELFDLIFRLHPNFSVNSCQWVLGKLAQEGKIYGIGYGLYRLLKRPFKIDDYHQVSKMVLKNIDAECRESERCVYKTSLLNELFGLEDGPNCTIVEVDKEQTFGLYYALHSNVSSRTMLNPSNHDLEMYYEEGSILVKKLFSKAPCQGDGKITIEKLIVDILTDSVLQYLYPQLNMIEKAIELIRNYDFKVSAVINYAKRRKIDGLIIPLLKDNFPRDLVEKLDVLN